MRNVRLIYTKTDRMKFVSHLDMNRYFIRLFRVASIPIWYTEGFHQHPYLSLALPLSLGYESNYEIADLKIVDDDYSNERLLKELNAHTVPGICFTDCFEPVKKTKEIARCVWRLKAEAANDAAAFYRFLSSESITAAKRNKKGEYHDIEIACHLKDVVYPADEDDRVIALSLPAGNDLNINPNLYLTAFAEQTGKSPSFSCLRTAVLDGEGQLFR